MNGMQKRKMKEGYVSGILLARSIRLSIKNRGRTSYKWGFAVVCIRCRFSDWPPYFWEWCSVWNPVVLYSRFGGEIELHINIFDRTQFFIVIKVEIAFLIAGYPENGFFPCLDIIRCIGSFVYATIFGLVQRVVAVNALPLTVLHPIRQCIRYKRSFGKTFMSANQLRNCQE